MGRFDGLARFPFGDFNDRPVLRVHESWGSGGHQPFLAQRRNAPTHQFQKFRFFAGLWPIRYYDDDALHGLWGSNQVRTFISLPKAEIRARTQDRHGQRSTLRVRRKGRIAPALAIVWVDQDPVRGEVAVECQDAMAQLTRVRMRWRHFERKDKPAFIRWRAREFGALLSEAREVEDRVREAQEIIHEVELELRQHFQTPQNAYARVKFRRQNPGAPEPAHGASGGGKRMLTEFEQEALFQEWVRKFLGTNPDKMDDLAYDDGFAAFRRHMFAQAAQTQTRVEKVAARVQPEEPPRESDDEVVVDDRVKVLYRRLARQLHPDTRADGNVEASALWHEVQEAYAASDVARLELLLALSHLQGDTLDGGTSVGELLLVRQELHRSLQALSKSVREAEQEDAWDFARSGPTPQLADEVERQLRFDLANRRRYLSRLELTLAAWQG